VDTASTFTSFFGDFETHVACLTPSSTPGVTHDPEFNAFFFTPTYNISGVVEFGSALAAVKDAFFIVLEDSLVCFDTHSEWLLHQCFFHRAR